MTVCRLQRKRRYKQSNAILLNGEDGFGLFHNPLCLCLLWVAFLALSFFILSRCLLSGEPKKHNASPCLCLLSPLEQVSGVFMVRGASWSEDQRGFPQARVELPAAVGVGRFVFFPPIFVKAPPTELH